jgi:hypothetical protein
MHVLRPCNRRGVTAPTKPPWSCTSILKHDTRIEHTLYYESFSSLRSFVGQLGVHGDGGLVGFYVPVSRLPHKPRSRVGGVLEYPVSTHNADS